MLTSTRIEALHKLQTASLPYGELVKSGDIEQAREIAGRASRNQTLSPTESAVYGELEYLLVTLSTLKVRGSFDAFNEYEQWLKSEFASHLPQWAINCAVKAHKAVAI